MEWWTVTGPHLIRPSERARAGRIVRMGVANLPRGAGVVSGCAEGVDSIAAYAAVGGSRPLKLVVPAAPHNDLMVQKLRGEPNVEVIEMKPVGGGPAAEYMARNDLAVELGADGLLALPLVTNFQPQSGTAATINRARKAGRTILFRPLSGERSWVENGAS